jgi:hypothetical protein
MNEKTILQKNIERRLAMLQTLSQQGFKNDRQTDFYKKMYEGLIEMEERLKVIET